MLLFRSEEEVAIWVERTAEPRGQCVLIASVWQLAQLWYRGRLSAAYRGHSAEQAEAIFAAVGLTGEFWRFASPE